MAINQCPRALYFLRQFGRHFGKSHRRMNLFHPRALLVVAFLGLLGLKESLEADLWVPRNLTSIITSQESRLPQESLSAVAPGALGLTDQSFLRRWWKSAVGIALVAAGVVWWRSVRPSNDRDWSPEYARTPWAEISPEQAVIHNFRNCEYRTKSDFIVRWETKTFTLSKLCGLDLFMNYWGSKHIAHTLLSFDFGDEGRVCTSIETRRESHEPYSPIRGFFRQYELYYVIGDERDLIGVRTNYRDQDLYLYRLARAQPEKLRALFLTYLRSVNDLRDRPRWYHATLSNCTTNIRVNAQASGFPIVWNWRMLVNGHLDELLYQRGMIPSVLPFTEIKARAQINERARSAGITPDFSERIRNAPS